ncbi:Glycine zipper 2TM domain-containing protein [Georgfuchsia toluolica]|uniref:Glycine zipper 2TM domain-containing protein n=1 Tax=Georgfuchsia toluolica TaxID=424218 RepID=A0A916J2A3_9PROT|nr:glycine zipper 2TM domain-containing protein [Georgfuchsia toluolica]CAG4882643.1 Glycine zipper 2TM domain-containing protein [Georgfuchsia toluolica]
MNMKKLATVVVIGLFATTAAAADATSKASYGAAKKEAATRYAEDKNLCAEETSSSARMQCLRDAKAEYKKALAAAKQATSAQPVAKQPVTRTSGVCAECGKVTSVKVVEKEGEGSPLGVIAGGVAGAVLGHQVGGGSGKDLATIAGAAGGAYAGHKIEQKVRSKKLWVVNVQFENGDERSFNFENDPGYAAGDAVKQTGNNIVRH